MNKKLKTLKDIENKQIDNYDFIVMDLRNTAREWIKKLCKDMNINPNSVRDVHINNMNVLQYEIDEYGKNPHEDDIRCAVAWIKYFFNLEEEK